LRFYNGNLFIVNCEIRDEDRATLYKICKNLHRIIIMRELLDAPLPSNRILMTIREFENYTDERIMKIFREKVELAEYMTEPSSKDEPPVERLFRRKFQNNNYFNLNP
jgi:hypothetical protein